MKILFKSFIPAVLGAMALLSCEDVPAPYVIPNGNGGGSDEPDTTIVVSPTGTGTLADPYNVAAANSVANALEKSSTSASYLSDEVYVKGIIVSVESIDISSYGNATYYISDTGTDTDQLEVYRGYSLNGDKFTSETEIQAGDTVVVCGQLQNWLGTLEFTQRSKIVSINGNSSSSDPTPSAATTEVNCAKAQEIGLALDDKATTSETYTVTGYITSVVGSVSQNQQSFWMADTKDGGNVLEAYWANLPEGVSEFTKGAKVQITGQIMRYGTTAEIKNATVVILEAADGGSETPAAGTDITCAKAQEIGLALDDKATTSETYNVTGYITSVVGSVSKNQQTFWMADTQDGGQVFEAYWANLPEGVSEFTQGSKVKITGQIMRYGTTAEIKNATVTILENGGGSSSSEEEEQGGSSTSGSDSNFAAADLGLENGTAFEQVSIGGLTLSVTSGGNTNSPKYYTNGTSLRMYPKNTLTLSSTKKISKVVLNCTSGSVASGDVSTNPGSINVVDPTITISDVNSTSVTITNNSSTTGAASQIRIVSFEITYAE